MNVAAEGANIIRREAKGYAGEGERGRGSVKAEGAGAEVFAGDGCSQGASFGPMAAISQRWRGGRIYNNTRTRERLRRKCVKPADLTTHSPPKPFARPRTATRPSRALPPPTQPRRMPAGCAMPSPPTAQPIPRRRPSLAPAQRHALPEHFCSPTRPRRTPAGCAIHSPPTPQPIPRRRLPLAPAQRHALAEHFRSPTQRRCTPAGCAIHSPLPSPPIPRRTPSPAPALRYALPAAPRSLPFRSASGTKKRHRTMHVRCRMSRSTVVAVGHWGW